MPACSHTRIALNIFPLRWQSCWNRCWHFAGPITPRRVSDDDVDDQIYEHDESSADDSCKDNVADEDDGDLYLHL